MMSDRERWIVYPLLILSLALGAKTRWQAWNGVSEFDVLTCRALWITNELDEPRAVLRENERGAVELALIGERRPDEPPWVGATVTVDDGGGRILLARRADRRSLVLGHHKLREISGLWAVQGDVADETLAPLAIDTGDNAVWELLPWPVPGDRALDPAPHAGSAPPDAANEAPQP